MGRGAGLTTRVADLQYRMFDRMRHRGAFEAARQPGTQPDFSALRGARQCLVVTFKASGEAVPTPVNFGLSDDGKLYFRSESRVAKIRRIRRDPHVRVCPSNMRGKPTGPLAEGVARIVDEDEVERAHQVVAANWRLDMRPVERALDGIGLDMVYVEITPTGV